MGGSLGGLIAAFPTPVTGSFESIATATPSTGSVTFSSIPQTYSSLQIRILAFGNGQPTLGIELNGQTSTTNYTTQYMRAANATITVGELANSNYLGGIIYGPSASTDPQVSIVDILNYSLTNSPKTIRAFTGMNNNSTSSELDLAGVLSNPLTAVSSVTIKFTSTNFIGGTRIALYGIKG